MFALLAVFFLAGCEEEAVDLKLIRVGVLPGESAERLRARYEPLVDYLSASTGLEHRLVIPENYGALLDLFSAGEIELAYFGGLTYLRAQASDGAVPLVMRDVDANFTTYFVVRADAAAQDISELTGQKLAFGSNLSTSGHLMPRKFLNDMGLVPERFFGEILYSGSHDNTAYMVRDGMADLGAVSAEVIRAMFADGRLSASDLRVLWETPPYPDYVWASASRVNDDIRAQIREAFLSISSADEAHRGVLAAMQARPFLPAADVEFDSLRRVATALELLDR